MTISSDAPLEDVLHAFSIKQSVPDAKLLNEFVRRYPQYSEELTDLAAALVLDAVGDGLKDPVKFGEEAAAAINSPEVSRAVSRFHSKLHAARTATGSLNESEDSPELMNVPNPFAALDPKEFKALADQLNITNVFLMRLRDRVIALSTIPKKFIQAIAEARGVAKDVVVAHLSSPPEAAPAGAEFYKSDKQPEAAGQQTFEHAVRTSGLSEEQQKRLMRY